MNFIYELIPVNIIEAIGWTIFHSLWQGALISIVLGIAILLIDNKSAKYRYALSVTSLLLLLISCTITFVKVYHPESAAFLPAAEVVSSTSNSSPLINDLNVVPETKSSLTNIMNEAQKYFYNHLPLVVTFWFAGLLIFSLRFIGGVIYIQRLKTQGIFPLAKNMEKCIPDLIAKANIKRTIQVMESALVKVPLAIGYLKPVILFPLGMISGLPQNQVEAIIAHEIAHIKRYDYIINFLQTFTETVFFYHPSVWWISAIIRIERENCCDDIAIELCGDPLTYSKALFNIQNMKHNETSFALAAIGNCNQLLRRIKRMNERNKTRITYGIKFAAFALLVLIIAVASLYSTKSYGSNPEPVNEASFVNPFSPLINELSISGSSVENTTPPIQDTINLKKGKHTFRFYEGEDENRIRYKAKLNDGKIEDLYIDGEKIPAKEFDKYENKVNKKIDEYEELMSGYRKDKEKYRKTYKEYSEKMKDYRKKLRDYRNEYRHWDDENFSEPDLSELREAMRTLRRELRDNFADHSFVVPPIPPVPAPEINIPEIDVPDVHIPPINIPEIDIDVPEINIPPINIPPIHIDPEYFDYDEFYENMDEYKHNMKKYKWNMDEFKENMKEFGKEMKKFGRFMEEAKDEMIKDGLINSEDDIDSFTLSENKMVVNGQKASPELHKKYLELYEKHTGKKLEGDKKIVIND